MAVVRNFPPLTNSSARIDPKDVLSYVYAFLQLWNLILVELFAYTNSSWKQQWETNTSTVKLFGNGCNFAGLIAGNCAHESEYAHDDTDKHDWHPHKATPEIAWWLKAIVSER